jgi:hypothetical protein
MRAPATTSRTPNRAVVAREGVDQRDGRIGQVVAKANDVLGDVDVLDELPESN